MSWQHYLTKIEGRPAQVLIDNRFALYAKPVALVNLAWFGVYCREDPGPAFWAPSETERLDALEDDLVRLCETIGHDWAVYLRRIATSGIREYYFYWGETADMSHVLPSLKALYPEYRIDYESLADPSWQHYDSWMSDAHIWTKP